jgi:DNA-binding transcriptional LysR family regulator
MNRLQAIEIFVRVADAGGFTRAAESLRVPRSTVSTVMQRLESELGVRLIQRTTRRMKLTAEGVDYLEWCKRLLVELDVGESMFAKDGGDVRGRLRVDVPSRIARRVIAPALPDFLFKHPKLEFELRSSDRAVDLVEEGVDCALRVGDLRDSTLTGRRIALLRMVNLASPAYLKRHGEPKSPDDLDEHFAVGYVSPSGGRIDDWEYVEEGILRQRRVPSMVKVDNAENYIACCLAGLGLIQIPAYDARDHVQRGELVEVLKEWPAAPMPLTALFADRRHLSPRIRVFLAWVGELFADVRS